MIYRQTRTWTINWAIWRHPRPTCAVRLPRKPMNHLGMARRLPLRRHGRRRLVLWWRITGRPPLPWPRGQNNPLEATQGPRESH